LYEGGIRVPAIIEWPMQIKANRITNINANTSDIYPTLLELAGVALPKNQPRLDGISLAPLFRGEKQIRKQSMGFWTYHSRGHGRRSRAMLEALRQEQVTGKQQPAAPEGEIGKHHPHDTVPGHAAWIEGDYKLHRVPVKKNAGEFNYELYHLDKDPSEVNNLLKDETHFANQFGRMKADLATWQQSVIKSLNGEDYR
jgi:arylsulfatase A-like enzyme